MSANRFGRIFTLTSFGESHGAALGAVIDGCPAGLPFDPELLRRELDRRRPGPGDDSGDDAQRGPVSPRDEPDEVELLSGVYEGRTLGTPIAMLVRNRDAQPQDYAELKPGSRPGHAVDLWLAKFGHVDARGSGRASGRETVARVMGGAVAQMLLRELHPGLRVLGFASRLGPLSLQPGDRDRAQALIERGHTADAFVAGFVSPGQQDATRELLQRAAEQGESWGARAELWIDGLPAGLGQPVFAKLKAELAAALMGVGACCGVALGEAERASRSAGSDFHRRADDPAYGGIRGGLSSGERLRLSVDIKPPASLGAVAQKGRHDPCLVTRVLPVLEAMCWMVLADHALWARCDRVG